MASPDVLTILLWFFLACNPSLADGNHWQYSIITARHNDHMISVNVARVPRQPDVYTIRLKYLNQELVVNAAHQLNGYRVYTLVPTGVADTFVPFIPHSMARPWKDNWTVATFMDDRYDVGAGVGPNDRVWVSDLVDTKANAKARAMFFSEVGLRRLHINGWDYSIVDVDYAHNIYANYPKAYEQDPLLNYRNPNDHVGPDFDTTINTPDWWYHGGVNAPKY